MTQAEENSFAKNDIDLDREDFLLNLLGELAGVLEDVIGLDDAEGFISVVGTRLGDRLGKEYRRVNNGEPLSREQLGDALPDLKRRIYGRFRTVSVGEEEIVLVNDRCPFGDQVLGRPSLCMMTSNVFGRIVADSRGYARIQIDKAIARGDAGCRVVLSFEPSADDLPGNSCEYFSQD